MSIPSFIKALFDEPMFEHGERVNLVQRGNLERTDGYVVAQSDDGVLVEWPNGGVSVVPVAELSLIS
jgi:hypothetical protein